MRREIPKHERIRVSTRELERAAGMSHNRIRAALDEALALHFIECVKAGRASSAGHAGATAVYALKWDATLRYARTAEEFRGFYENEGHRTDTPNQFFDLLIPRGTFAVIKVGGGADPLQHRLCGQTRKAPPVRDCALQPDCESIQPFGPPGDCRRPPGGDG